MKVYSADEFPPCPLWEYAVEIYGKKTVSRACLSLQDRHEIDVNLTLFCLWCGARGQAKIMPNELSQALDISSNWQVPVIMPLRCARRAIRNANVLSDGQAKLNLRKAVIENEIYAERLELQMLAKLAKPTITNSVDDPACALNAASNLYAYLSQKIENFSETDISDILCIWARAFPNAKEAVLLAQFHWAKGR